MGTSAYNERLRQLREREREEGEPVKTVERTARPDGSSETPIVNLGDDALQIAGIAPGTPVSVDIHRGYVVVRKEATDADA